jgi:hypothetical protein
MDPSENSDRSGKFSNPVRIIRLKIESKAQHTWTATLSIIRVLLSKYCNEVWNRILNLPFCAVLFLLSTPRRSYIFWNCSCLFVCQKVFYFRPWKLAQFVITEASKIIATNKEIEAVFESSKKWDYGYGFLLCFYCHVHVRGHTMDRRLFTCQCLKYFVITEHNSELQQIENTNRPMFKKKEENLSSNLLICKL